MLEGIGGWLGKLSLEILALIWSQQLTMDVGEKCALILATKETCIYFLFVIFMRWNMAFTAVSCVCVCVCVCVCLF